MDVTSGANTRHWVQSSKRLELRAFIDSEPVDNQATMGGAWPPDGEMWLYENPIALESVLLGIAQSAKGAVKRRGSFGRYANTRID
jgi:hypothetical protein